MKTKKKKTVIIVFVVILVLILGFFGTIYYITSTVNNYTYSEKRWINDNANKSLDIYIEPDLPVFTDNGKGVYYDYINALREDTGLKLNVITENKSNIRLVNKNRLDKDDIVFYKDHFIVLGNGTNVNKIEDLENKKVGVITSDKKDISYYLTEYKNINLVSFETYADMLSGYTNKSVEYMIIPMYKHLNEIVTNKNYDILLHLDGLYSYYCLDLDSETEELETINSILTKFYYRYKDKAGSKINEYFLNIYYDSMNYTELQKESITSDDFIVGYIDNLPYEGMIAGNFTGLTDAYLSKFSYMTGVTYKYIAYKDTKELGEALKEKKIDLALNYYSLSNANYDTSRILGPSEYVVLAHDKNNIVINSLYSLSDTYVSMLNNMNLKYNMASRNLFEMTDYTSVKSLLKNVDEDSIIIIEKEVYDYYKD